MSCEVSSKIEGVTVSPLKKIINPKGDILHAIKSGSNGFNGFGEAYFSMIKKGCVKGWKKHLKMTLNLVVPQGEIRFVVYDDRENSLTKMKFFQINLSLDNYCRLTVSPGLWVAFQGISEGFNLLLNVANIEHDPDESRNVSLKKIAFNWEQSG